MLDDMEKSYRKIIESVGENPNREGLKDTPKRVVKAYKEFFKGYDEDPVAVLSRTFEEVGGYDDIVMLRDIDINSHCEHHMIPFIGRAHIAYFPTDKVVGISKLARVVEIYARSKRLDSIGMAMDFRTLKTAARETIAAWDHQDLNQ